MERALSRRGGSREFAPPESRTARVKLWQNQPWREGSCPLIGCSRAPLWMDFSLLCFHFSICYEKEFLEEVDMPATREGPFSQPCRVSGQSFL